MTTELIQRTNTEPWYSGMRNLIKREIFHERGRMYWIQQILVWTFLAQGLVALVNFTMPLGVISDIQDSYFFSLGIFYQGLGFFLCIFIPVLLQGTAIDEILSGMAAWILSKPVSKKAYLLSKLAAGILAIVTVSVVLQGAIAYGVFAVLGYAQNVLGFVMTLGLASVVAVYFTSMTIMLGTLTISRGKVLAAALGVGLGAQFVVSNFPMIMFVIPYALPLLGLGLVTGGPVTGLGVMLLSAIFQIIVFTAIALRVFDRTEL